MAERGRIAYELAQQYLDKHPSVREVVWFPRAADNVIALLIVTENETVLPDPIEPPPSSIENLQVLLETRTCADWDEVLRGDQRLPAGFVIQDYEVIPRVPVGEE